MKDIPIPFSAPMVRAVLAGTKTQTRRVIARPLSAPGWTSYRYFGPSKNDPTCRSMAIECGPDYPDGDSDKVMCPFGAAGDRLWVREAWRSGTLTDCFKPSELTPHSVWYEADGEAPPATNGRLRPGMFMPRWASRITLEVTGIRVEQLQEISVDDCRAEGGMYDSPIDVRAWYRDVWESINGPGSWAANPWVWVIEFKRIEAA